MGVLSDALIRQLALGERGMINPFSKRVANPRKLISWGLQPAGYVARLDPDVLVFDLARAQGAVLDPLDFHEECLVPISGNPLIELPPQGLLHGTTIERFHIPRNVMVLGCGINAYTSIGVRISPVCHQPGWEGRIQIHVANPLPVAIRLHGGEGILNLQFHVLEAECEEPFDELIRTSFQRQP